METTPMRNHDDSVETPVLPDWTRWSWASSAEREWWAPLLSQASRAFIQWERYAVVDDIRPACWAQISATDLVATTEWAHQFGLVVVPTGMTGSCVQYTSTAESVRPGQPFDYRCVITKPEHLPEIFNTKYSLDERMGAMLGYPTCCQDAFAKTWGAGQVDNTWEQWQNTQAVSQTTPHVHTLLRWMGIRLTPHMPCSYHCAASGKIAQQFADIGIKYGNKDDVLVIQEVLQWPVSWSRLFGIAVITTPALKISTRSDWTPTLDAFEKPGVYNKPESWLWTDNGYSGPTAMLSAHAVLIASLAEELPKGARVCDLGCGNGLLLRRLTSQRPDLKIGGIDTNAAAIAHIPPMCGKWMTGTIESGDWLPWKPDATVISVQRLLEMSADDCARVIHGGGQMVIYGYEDTLKDEPLETLTARLGLQNFRMLQKTPGVSVGILTAS